MSWPWPDHGLRGRLRGKLSHAYVISGADGTARAEAAEFLAAAALCFSDEARPCGVCRNCRKVLARIHPDLHRYECPAGSRQIPVELIRQLRAEAHILPNEAEKSVFVVSDAHLMNLNAQNALLKVFEEPPGFVMIILLAENEGELLPTLLSRAVSLRLFGEAEPEGDEALAKTLVSLISSGKSAEAVTACLKLDKLERDELALLLTALRRRTVEELIRGGGTFDPELAGDLLRELDELMRCVEFNVGAGHIAGALAAFAAEQKWK